MPNFTAKEVEVIEVVSLKLGSGVTDEYSFFVGSGAGREEMSRNLDVFLSTSARNTCVYCLGLSGDLSTSREFPH